MAQSYSGGGRPTHYEILSITPKHLEGQSDPSQAKVIKKAYHRALLRHHPDKANASNSRSSSTGTGPSRESHSKSKPSKPQSSSSSTTTTTTTTTYTVDQIQEAYSVLSDSKRRTEYNRTLFQKTTHNNNNNNNSTSSSHSNSNNSSSGKSTTAATWSFRTGVETVDLDDLGFDERTGVYYRSCRCGNARGYRFEDADLEECEGEGVLMVECLDCSLWLRVLFAPAGDDGDVDNHDEEEKTVVNNNNNNNHHHQPNHNREVASGERSGGGETSRGFKFNWSFSWGVSVGGSASASTSASSAARRIGN